MNVTDIHGKTIIKFSTGLSTIQKRKSSQKKKLASLAKFILAKIHIFVKNNFDSIKIIIKGEGHKSFSFLKEFLRNKRKLYQRPEILYFENRLPIVHNGCRPPSKRRL